MVNRHVVTKQRLPSTKSIIKNIEAELAVETTEKGKIQLQRALDYWKGKRRKS